MARNNRISGPPDAPLARRQEPDAIVAHAIDYAKGADPVRLPHGWRVGEILPLQWDRVDWDAGAIRLRRSKNGEGHTFYHDGQGLRSIHRAFAGAVTRAGMIFGRDVPGGITLHDLRRSPVRNFDRAGLSMKEGMSLSGHNTPSVPQRYDIVDTNRRADAVARLAAWRARHNRGTTAPQQVRPLRTAQEA